MSAAKEVFDGGPAFPMADDRDIHHGMSLRDWFAGQALTGMMSSESSGDGLMPVYEPKESWPERAAVKAYSFADAMLAARKAKP